MAADFTINIEFLTEAAGFFTFNPWRGFLTMGNTIKAQVFDYAMKIMMMTKFQEVMLRFINSAIFPVLFVVGSVLRIFIFTRKLGGLLMAIAIVLYFVFPMFYAFAGLIVIDIKNQFRPVWCNGDTKLNPQGCSPGLFTTGRPDPPIADTILLVGKVPVIGSTTDSMDSSEPINEYQRMKTLDPEDLQTARRTGVDPNDPKKKYVPDFNLFNNKMDSMNDIDKRAYMEAIKSKSESYLTKVSSRSLIDTFVFTDAFYPGGPLDILARLAFFSVFFAFFAVLASIAAIRSVSITLGGDIEIAGLTRLI
jgi:hypothetical protein